MTRESGSRGEFVNFARQRKAKNPAMSQPIHGIIRSSVQNSPTAIDTDNVDLTRTFARNMDVFSAAIITASRIRNRTKTHIISMTDSSSGFRGCPRGCISIESRPENGLPRTGGNPEDYLESFSQNLAIRAAASLMVSSEQA